MKINIQLSDKELKEVHYAIDKQLEEVEYEIDEIEDTPVLRERKKRLENSLSKLNLAYDYENRIKGNSENNDIQKLIDKCNFNNEKILSYIHYSEITETPRAVIGEDRDDFKANYTVVYEDERWSVDV